jgi:hypothetical protein
MQREDARSELIKQVLGAARHLSLHTDFQLQPGLLDVIYMSRFPDFFNVDHLEELLELFRELDNTHINEQVRHYTVYI